MALTRRQLSGRPNGIGSWNTGVELGERETSAVLEKGERETSAVLETLTARVSC